MKLQWIVFTLRNRQKEFSIKVTKKKPWSIVCCGLCCIWPYTKVWPEYDFTFHHCPFVKHWRHPLNKKASNCKLSIACKCPNHTYSVGSVKTSCAPDKTLMIKIIFSQYSHACISASKRNLWNNLDALEMWLNMHPAKVSKPYLFYGWRKSPLNIETIEFC